MRHKSWMALALDKHTSRQQSKTLEDLQEWLGRSIEGWQVDMLLQLRGMHNPESDMRAISEMGVSPENVPHALRIAKQGRLKVLKYNNTATGKFEYESLPYLADREVYVSHEIDGARAQQVLDNDTVIVKTDNHMVSARLRETFGWEEL